MARQRTVTKNRYIFFIISQGRKIRILNAYTGDPNTKDESRGRAAQSGRRVLTHVAADPGTGAPVRPNLELQLAGSDQLWNG